MPARRRSSCSAIAVSRVLLALAEVGGGSGGGSVAGVSSGVGVGEVVRVNCVIRALSSRSRAGSSSLGKRMWRVVRRAFLLAVKFLRGFVGASCGGWWVGSLVF